MSLVYSRTDSGLLVAENASSDERAVARALKQHDPDLRLVPRRVNGVPAWSVYRYCGSEREADFVCFWGNDAGEPWPLSMRLVDYVQNLDRNSPASASYLTADERNERFAAKLAADSAADTEALVSDWQVTERSRPLLPRGVSLRMSRDKRRARGEVV